MLFFKKHKENKINKEFEDVMEEIKVARVLGTRHIYLPLSINAIPMVKNWCKEQNYKIEVDHIDENDKEIYKIWGWE